MKTLEYLQTHSLDDLCNEFHIVAKRHGEFPNLVQLKYSQIESPMGEPIVQECRGLILDEADNWRVVCRPYSKFFNYGEGHAAPIDWSTARVYEKLDGSLMSMYEYRGQWHVASSGLPDAAGPVHTFQGTFRDLFWRVWDQLGYHTPNITECRDLCFMFELMTPHNRVIVPQHDHRLVLHGIRNRVTGEEFDPSRIFGWDVVKRFPLDSIENCIAAANALNPMECEGYVVCDREFRRVKVKSPQYVALAHLKEGMSLRRLIEIVRANESDEFLTYFPEWSEAYHKVRKAYVTLCADLAFTYERIKDLPTQKEFALEACKTKASAPLFALRAGKCESIQEFFKTATVPSLEKALGLDQRDVFAIQPSEVAA